MIQEDKTSTKKMLSTKNNIYIGLCILYILLSMINRKYPIGDVTLHIVYLSTWFFLLLWEIVDVLRDIPKIIKFKATNSLRVSCLFCIFKHSPPKTV